MSGNSGTTSYSLKTNVPCSTPVLRTFSSSNQTSSQAELEYINNRKPNVQQAWKSWLGDATQIGYEGKMSLTEPPTVGITMAGAGLRGSLFSTGVLNAFDSTNATAKRVGTGGFLGSALFTVGFGGSFPLRGRQSAFIATNSLNKSLTFPGGSNMFSTNNQDYYGSILSSVKSKADANFNTSLVDIWGRMLSYHFLDGTTPENFFTNDTDHGASVLMSDLPQQAPYKNYSLPLPITALYSQVGDGSDTTPPIVYEMTPFEMGSFDPRLSAMAQTKYLGTPLNAGQPANNGSCVTGFDQAGFVLGTSSSPFYNAQDGNSPNTSGWDSDDVNAFTYLLGRLKNEVKSNRYDVANWPNPFQGINTESFPHANQESLQLGGSQNYLPIEQLMVKSRQVDVIIVLDSTGETTENKWPDGTAMQVAKQRVSTVLNQTHNPFPPIPDNFTETGVSLRPTFFGCPNSTVLPEWPLIIYIPNAPPVDGGAPVTNPTGFKTSYTDWHQDRFFDQAYASATSGFVSGKPEADTDFPKCLQCAAVDRQRFTTTGSTVPRSDFCATCLKKYCYDEANPPSSKDLASRQLVFMDPGGGNSESFFQQHRAQIIGGAVGGAALLIAFVLAFFFWRRRRSGVKYRGSRGGRPPPINVDNKGKYEPL